MNELKVYITDHINKCVVAENLTLREAATIRMAYINDNDYSEKYIRCFSMVNNIDVTHLVKMIVPEEV